MDAVQLAEYLQQNSPLLVDVREPWEFEVCHINGMIQYLQQQAIVNLINLDGGVDAWARQVDSDMPLY